VFDPSGRLPLYDVMVYVPSAPLEPISTGPSCDRCDRVLSGSPIARARTDATGRFVLSDVPAGVGVPLVMQTGKWRRLVTLPELKACAINTVEDPSLLRLPRNQREGSIPRIALATGGLGGLECLLRKLGIDDSEFTPETGSGRVNLYAGQGMAPMWPPTTAYAPTLNGGAAFTSASLFWINAASVEPYDMIMLSCEGNWFSGNKRAPAPGNLAEFANRGGRVLLNHWHGYWMQFGRTSWEKVATFVPPSPQGTMVQLPDLPDGYLFDVDTSFPKGAAFAEWLVAVNASPTLGKLPVLTGKRSVLAVDPALARRWLYTTTIPPELASGSPATVEHLTFTTPVGAEPGKECGRVAFTDLHTEAKDVFGAPFPGECVTTELSPQERTMAFTLFQLSSCVEAD
jgi:hypothetical protein